MQPIDSFAGWWRNDVRLNSLTPKISLKTKTRAIFALLLILFAAVAAYAFMELSAISRQAESSKTVWEARIVAANAILRDAQNYRIAEALRLLPSSPEMAAQADDDLKANAEGMEQSIAAYRAQLHPQEAQTQINKAKELWGEYLSGNRIMLEYADGGDAEAAVDRFRNSASGFYLVADAAEAMVTTAQNGSAEAYAQSLKISERARWGLIGGVAFVICFLVFSTVFFETQVWRELVRMSDVMQRLARGDLAAEVTGTSRPDEVGEMARAIEVFKVNAQEVLRLETEADVQESGLNEERAENDRRLAHEASTRAMVVEQIAQAADALE